MKRHHAKQAAETVADALGRREPAAERRLAKDLLKLDLPKPDYRPMQAFFQHLAAAVRNPREHRP